MNCHPGSFLFSRKFLIPSSYFTRCLLKACSNRVRSRWSITCQDSFDFWSCFNGSLTTTHLHYKLHVKNYSKLFYRKYFSQNYVALFSWVFDFTELSLIIKHLHNNLKMLEKKKPYIFGKLFSYDTLRFNEIHDSRFCRNKDSFKFFNMLKAFNPVMN